MSKIQKKIENCNTEKQKALTIFLTSGYPNPESFVDLALNTINAGADILEIGIPFGDSLADGPVIQASYNHVLKKNINLKTTLNYVSEIKRKSDVPIILMSSSNLLLNHGRAEFSKSAIDAGVDGLIIPDVPLEEYDGFFDASFQGLDTILLTTPTSSENRISEVDKRSSGFIYCVSVVGTTGARNKFDHYVFENLKRTYNYVNKNKMQIGFGISNTVSIKQFSPYCDGFIVGSAVIKSLAHGTIGYTKTFSLIEELKKACIT